MMMESTESRFAHLLQPIRELTKNWEIDVASELNDYLEELDEMCITFDGGKIRLNFAEAALLIQGSTCIYSKKVELLYSLVYQTLEYINDKNKKRNKQASSTPGGDGPARNDEDDVAEFTSLDLEVSESSQTCDPGTTVDVIPLPPESLIPPEAHEKQKLPLISVKGEIVCSQKDFRINLFIPREDLILLTHRPAGSTDLHLHLPQNDEFQQQQQEAEGEFGGGAAGGGDDAADGFPPLEENHMELEVEEHIDRQQAQSEGRMVRERRQVEADKRPAPETPPAVNVWAFHDPYATIEEDRPFKSEKCYKVPDGLEDGGKRKRRRAALQDFRSWFTGTFCPSEHKLKNGPKFTDLNYMYVSTMKHRLRTQRRIYRKTGVVISEEELRRTLLQPEEAGPQQEGEGPVEAARCDLLGGDDDASDAELEGFPDDVPAELGGNDVVSAEPLRDELSYEDLVKLRVEQLVVSSRGYTRETSLSRRVKDWEDKIRPELDLQEQRPVFDIHEYGGRIVDSLSSVGHRRAFSSIVHGLDNYEACKYLLSSLQLANDYTVEIDSAVGLEDSLDSMGLTLLSTDRATDRFKTLTAS
ncbi:condensin-2 complex subunit H2 isoform X2 [Salarias fasciatus]|uniref:condensin-2 complex subunit H2 isoform X2 n=1 Tax=Salarias fasciatus TaxID=181472 RepID=UPI0011770339|nr:condensin-2 complex subunit H2 isoform X2 [Salarias fasciatus]